MFRKGVKSKDLSKALGVSGTSVVSWRGNKSQPSLENLYKLAAFLNVEVPDLLAKENPFECVHVAQKGRSVGFSEQLTEAIFFKKIQLKEK